MTRTTSLTALVVWLFLTSFSVAGPREEFLKLIDRPPVPLNPIVNYTVTADGSSQQQFDYQVEAGQRVPGIIVQKVVGPIKRPAVIVLHGTSGTYPEMLPHLKQLAEAGFVAVAIDGRYHGFRSVARARGNKDYFAAIVRAWKDGKEHPFYFDTVWDVMRLIDYLQTRDDIDGSRIGLMGISKGGIETYLTAAVDPRVAAAVPMIGVQSFKWALENNQWQPRIGTIQSAFDAIMQDAGVRQADAMFVKKFYDRVAPGIDGPFDGPSMLPLIAPRPLMVINGELDDRTPLPGLKLCTDAAQAAYTGAAAADRFVILIQPRTGHKVNPESHTATVEFFAKWLKPAGQ